MPVGIAGVVAFCFGICSTVLSMNQTWYQGVIARKIGDSGGDISFEMNIMFAFIGYNLVRPFELKYFGRSKNHTKSSIHSAVLFKCCL